jgi:cytochrome c biogenesis protein CcmG/thiol:disulfide interchange protein DsbE
MKRKWVLWLPLLVMLLLFAGFYLGLRNPGDRIIASNLVGEDLPEFTAVAAVSGQPGTDSDDFRQGKPRLLNVFASWCVPCVREIAVLGMLKAQGVEIAGIAVHDTPDALRQFLAQNGNPYDSVGLDEEGKAQIAIGSSGVPETFVIDGQGHILHQHIGIVTPDDIPVLLAKLQVQ